MGINQLILVTD